MSNCYRTLISRTCYAAVEMELILLYVLWRLYESSRCVLCGWPDNARFLPMWIIVSWISPTYLCNPGTSPWFVRFQLIAEMNGKLLTVNGSFWLYTYHSHRWWLVFAIVPPRCTFACSSHHHLPIYRYFGLLSWHSRNNKSYKDIIFWQVWSLN